MLQTVETYYRFCSAHLVYPCWHCYRVLLRMRTQFGWERRVVPAAEREEEEGTAVGLRSCLPACRRVPAATGSSPAHSALPPTTRRRRAALCCGQFFARVDYVARYYLPAQPPDWFLRALVSCYTARLPFRLPYGFCCLRPPCFSTLIYAFCHHAAPTPTNVLPLRWRLLPTYLPATMATIPSCLPPPLPPPDPTPLPPFV